MDNLTIQPKSQPVSTLAATQAQVKAKHPDCIALIRKNDWYLTVEEDAVKASKTLCITLTKTQSGERQAAVAREISKVHEETVRGTLGELVAHFTANEPRGEIVLLVAGKDE